VNSVKQIIKPPVLVIQFYKGKLRSAPSNRVSWLPWSRSTPSGLVLGQEVQKSGVSFQFRGTQ